MPMRLAKLAKYVKPHGVVFEPGKGSHMKATRGEEPVYPVPAHDGMKTDLPDVYVKGLCKHFGIKPPT